MGLSRIVRGAARSIGGGAPEAAAHTNDIIGAPQPGASAFATPTGMGPVLSRQDQLGQLEARKRIHFVRNQLMAKAEELRKLGSMIEAVARDDGANTVATHVTRYQNLEAQAAELLIRHDGLLVESGQQLDETVRAAVDLIVNQRDPAKLLKVKLPTGETALEVRINQLLGDKPQIRRPVIDASATPRAGIADRFSTDDTPKATIDRYQALIGGAERPSSVPVAADATAGARTLPDATRTAGHERNLPGTDQAPRSIRLPAPERQAPQPGTKIGRDNRVVNFLDRKLDDEVAATEVVTDADMQRRLKQLQENPDLAPGFQGVSFDIGDDNSGVVKRRI